MHNTGSVCFWDAIVDDEFTASDSFAVRKAQGCLDRQDDLVGIQRSCPVYQSSLIGRILEMRDQTLLYCYARTSPAVEVEKVPEHDSLPLLEGHLAAACGAGN